MTDHEIATEVVFEDEEVRVWNQVVKKEKTSRSTNTGLIIFCSTFQVRGQFMSSSTMEQGGLLVKPLSFSKAGFFRLY